MNLDELLTELIPNLVPNLCRKFPTLSREDIEPQCWVGCLEHRKDLEGLLEAGNLTKLGNDAKDYATKSVLAMRREQDRYQRALRAASHGYAPEDQMHYPVGALRALIPAYLDSGISPNAPKTYKQSVQSMLGITGAQGDPAESGNWLAMMMDVDRAFWQISRHHRIVLARYFSYPHGSGGWTHIEIASAMGIDPTALEGRVKRALRAMQQKLGGPSPWPRT